MMYTVVGLCVITERKTVACPRTGGLVAAFRCAAGAGPVEHKQEAECVRVPSRWQLDACLAISGLDQVMVGAGHGYAFAVSYTPFARADVAYIQGAARFPRLGGAAGRPAVGLDRPY